jgi:hydroxymethylglutaryl-CoA lyase
MTSPAKTVRIVEVGPRDGLQNEPNPLSVAIKLQLIELLAQAGLTTIEAGSFVNPRWVPQMAGSDELFSRLDLSRNINYTALTPNRQGLERALALGVKEVAVFAAASESFSQKNINCSIAESLQRFREVTELALQHKLRIRGYISCVVGCPYEGDVDVNVVHRLADELLTMGCYEVSLGDTIGVGTPKAIVELIQVLGQSIAIDKMAMHLHDTYGQAIANIYAAWQEGIQVFDSSIAGLGGCPYAKGATGNVATEDVVYLFNGLGVDCGIAMDKLLDASAFISAQLQREPVSRAGRALLAKRRSS